MAADPSGSTKNLSDSRAEALQALVNSLAPGQNPGSKTPSKEDVSKLSDKLKELLGDVDSPQDAIQRNERGELLNEEGLPIIEITQRIEGVPETTPGASSGTAPTEVADDAGFVPMCRLPPVERARNRAQMDRILDILEEEERVEEERNLARDREQRQEDLERRKANAKAEFERLKAAKEVQKKMGKALLKNMADAREKEETERARQEKEDLEKEEARRSRKPRKSVSWADLPKQDKDNSSARTDGDAARSLGKLPMRPNVVERFPARPGASSPPPPVPTSDSDDESDPPSPDPSDSDPGEGISSDHFPSSHAEPPLSEGSEDEDGHDDSQGSGDGFDIDAMQHQREIALAYFEKRNAVGADAARAMSAHSHDIGGEDEWDQEDVPLEATLAGPRPKPAQSKFRSERLAQAYGTRVPSSTPSTSLGTSVLPNSTNALRGGMRMGRLEPDGQLVGNSDSDGEGEDDAARTREFVDALYRGDVTNAGAAENSDALIKALESAYGAPSQSKQPPLPPPPTAPGSDPQKSSRFKLARAVPPSTLANDESPREGGASLSSKPPTSATVLERKPAAPAPAPVPSSFKPTAAPPSPAPVGMGGSPSTAPQLPPMIVNSPSFAPPGGDAPMMVIDSPSFRPPHASARLRRPPTVLATVRESSPSTQPPPPPSQQQQRGQAPEPGKKVSRFKAQRAES